MTTPIYIAMGIHVENGSMATPSTRQFTDRNQAERQYHLYCAAAATSNFETDTAILMTVDGFVLEKATWEHTVVPEQSEEPTEE